MLNVAATVDADFGRRILHVAGASSSFTAAGSLTQYHIPKRGGVEPNFVIPCSGFSPCRGVDNKI